MNRLSRHALSSVLPPLLLLGGVVFVWHVAVESLQIKPFLFPAPAAVLEAARVNAADLIRATCVTAAGALCGFAASIVFGALIAFVFAQSRMIRLSCYPYAIFLQTVPIVAVAPLVILWFGAGFLSVAIIAFIISLFPIITNTTTGLTRIDRDLLDLFEANNATRLQLLFKLRLPNAVPYLIAGARISSGLSVIGAIVGEFMAGFGGQAFGLGYLIQFSSTQMKTAYLFAAIVASALLGLAIFTLINAFADSILRRWHQ